MILTAVGIFFGVDRKFQAYVLDQFPQYGTGLTNLEDNAVVRQALDELKDDEVDEEDAGKPIWGKPMNEVQERSVYPVAPELVPGGEWFNSEPLTLSGLRGKVVLIDFWTYSCINCIRTMPYLRDWWSKYEDDGLVIIGVHAPEFEFEKSAENVARAIEDFELTYPVMQDNDFATWRAYDNRYWPAKYLIDKNGQIRYTHFGEGKYAETEEMIQKLLQETGVRVEEALGDAEYTIYSRTPEIYLGYGRMQYLASGEMIRQDEVSDYNMPTPLATNSFGLGGMWKVTEEYAQSGKGSALALQFDAREVFLVMRSDVEAEVKVWLDGEPATQAGVAGSDVGDESTVKVQIDRLYRLIELPDAGQHELLLEFEDVGVQVFAFTFG
jgi:thiol-disulfide isomerase/thioredoxin